MASNEVGIYFPQGGDAFSPHTDVESLGDSLRGRTVVPVANATGLATLLSDLSAGGYTPSASNPVWAWRADNKTLNVHDGSGWLTLTPGPTVDWTPLLGGAGWGGGASGSRRADVVYLRGAFSNVSGSAVSVAFNAPQMGTLPPGLPAPASDMVFPIGAVVQGTVSLRITTGGALILRAHSGSPSLPAGQYVELAGISWPIG